MKKVCWRDISYWKALCLSAPSCNHPCIWPVQKRFWPDIFLQINQLKNAPGADVICWPQLPVLNLPPNHARYLLYTVQEVRRAIQCNDPLYQFSAYRKKYFDTKEINWRKANWPWFKDLGLSVASSSRWGQVISSLKNHNASQVGCAKCLVKRYGLYSM